MYVSTFDAEGFFSSLEAVREDRNLTWRQVALEAGISASTLTRISQGKRPDVDSLSALISWSGLDSREYLGKEAQNQPSSLASVLAQFRADPNLSADSAKALESLVKAAYKNLQMT